MKTNTSKKLLFTMKVKQGEVDNWRKLAEEEGHGTVAGLIKWLIHQYKNKRLVLKR